MASIRWNGASSLNELDLLAGFRADGGCPAFFRVLRLRRRFPLRSRRIFPLLLLFPPESILHLAQNGRTNEWARAHFFVAEERAAAEAWKDMDLIAIREAAERVARSEGLEVVDVEWKTGKQRFLRVTIDRPLQACGAPPEAAGGKEPARPASGVSHGDCERVSQQLSVILDVEELVPGPRYVLEISSPGLDRQLSKPAEFERFRGRLARISTCQPVEDAKFFEGRLAGFAAGKVRLELQGRERRVVEVPLDLIRKAKLVVEF